MAGTFLNRLLEGELHRRAGQDLLRTRRVLEAIDSTHVVFDGASYVNFASNDYLGLTHHPRVVAAAGRALRRHGAGSGASALVTGHLAAHADAEAALAAWKRTEAAVLLPSGYQTAHAVVQTLAGVGNFHPGGVRFIVDKLCHASLVDAVRGSEAKFRVFPHNHLGKLERLLAEAPAEQLQVVVTESIFSMDGDAADLAGLAELKRRRPFVLLLDEAHGSGVYGPDGAGYAAEMELRSSVDVALVTLSKAAGVGGGAACGSKAFCDALVNWGRAYVYSTSLPPAAAAAIAESLRVMADEPHRRRRVRALALHVRAALARSGLAIPHGDSPIIPVLFGTEGAALRAADSLREQRLLVVPIRPPTVPRGASRLRITLSCDHADADVDRLVEAVVKLPREG